MRELSKGEIRDIYDAVAPRFDALEALPEWLGVRRLRRRLLGRARGRVLEAAIGTGRDLPHYPAGCAVTGIDLSRGMLEEARGAAAGSGRDPPPLRSLAQADTERLPFRDGTFDTVVDALTLCTYPDPARALGEMARVCRPAGRILLLEHGRSDRRLLGWLQDRWAGPHYRKFGCRLTREPRQLVERAGLAVESADRTFLGVFHLLEARPTSAGSSRLG